MIYLIYLLLVSWYRSTKYEIGWDRVDMSFFPLSRYRKVKFDGKVSSWVYACRCIEKNTLDASNPFGPMSRASEKRKRLQVFLGLVKRLERACRHYEYHHHHHHHHHIKLEYVEVHLQFYGGSSLEELYFNQDSVADVRN